MKSTVPAFSFSEPGLVNQVSDFLTGFTPWDLDCSDLFSVIQSSLEPVVPSPCSGESDTGYIRTNTGFNDTCIGSIKTNLDSENTTNSCDHNLQMSEERKRKRMESNRESAKRSRKRKQKYIENLKEDVNRLGLENRQLGNRLRIVLYHMEEMSRETNGLFSEQEILRRRFSEMRRILILRQLQSQQQWARERDNGRMIMTEQNPSFIIDHQLI